MVENGWYKTMDNEITIFPNINDLFHYAATDFCKRALKAIEEKGSFSVVLSGGNTPKAFYDLLTSAFYKEVIPWSKIQFFFGDERYVPKEDDASNFHMTQEHLFAKVPVDPNHIYRMPTEFDDPKDAAHTYEKTLRQVLATSAGYPAFDLIYLGLGDDAHTASLMPDTDIVKAYADDKAAVPSEWVSALYVPHLNMYRITLTPPAINHFIYG